jgi:hypothetical protein
MPVNTNIVEVMEIPEEEEEDLETNVYHSVVDPADSEDNWDRLQVLEQEVQKVKKKLRFEGVEVPARNTGKGKAPYKPSPLSNPPISAPAPARPSQPIL